MTVAEIFAKATTENKALTVEEFNRIAQESKAKFTDLAEGKYVDRQKYLDELAAKDTQIAGLNETITKRDTDLQTLQTQLKDAGTDAGKLEELTGSLAQLQEKYTHDVENLKGQLTHQAYEFAVRDFAAKQKFSSTAAQRDFVANMIAKNLPMESGVILGADDFMKVYAKENKDAFYQEQPKQNDNQQTPPPQFSMSTPGDKGGQGQKYSLSELMQMKNNNPNAIINFE